MFALLFPCRFGRPHIERFVDVVACHVAFHSEMPSRGRSAKKRQASRLRYRVMDCFDLRWNGAKADVADHRATRRDKFAPPCDADDVQTRPLFGDLIQACMASRDAQAAGSKRTCAPTPGVLARRRCGTRIRRRSRRNGRYSARRRRGFSHRPRCSEACRRLRPRRGTAARAGATPSGLSPSLTRRASAPSTRRPPRMVSFRHQDSGEIGDGDAVSPTRVVGGVISNYHEFTKSLPPPVSPRLKPACSPCASWSPYAEALRAIASGL